MKGWGLIEGVQRAFRAWPMALMLAALVAFPAGDLSPRDRLSAVDLGIGGFPFNISAGDHYTGTLGRPEIATLGLLFIIWIFLSGGIIDRLARDGRTGSRRFFAACGACFAPLVRLALLSLLAYAAVLAWIEPWMRSVAYDLAPTARLALFGSLATLLFFIALVFDYARVRLVIEDRRSAAGAILASLRMLCAHGAQMILIQAAFWLPLVLWISIRTRAVADPALWTASACMAGDLVLKLMLLAAQTSIYQQHLASAGWVARAEPSWPDDPSENPAAL
jgi:hypothetical protein